MTRQAIVGAVAGVAIAVGLFTVHIVRAGPEYSFSGSSVGGTAATLVTGWSLVAAGLAFSARPRPSRFGLLLVGAGLTWFLLEWPSPASDSALAFTLGLCLYAVCPALVGYAVLAFPGGRLRSTAELIAVVLSAAGAVLVLGLLRALLFDPRAQGCKCPRNLVLVADNGRAASDLARTGVYLGIAWSGALAVLCAVRLRKASRSGWGPSVPVFAAGAAYLTCVCATFIASRSRGFLWNGTVERRLWLGEAVVLIAMAASLGWSVVRVPRARAAVARLVVELDRSLPPGSLRDILADTVGDPELALGYPVGEAGALLDARGRPMRIPEHLERTNLVRAGETVAVLGHTPALLDDPHLTAEVTAAARLALENERLQAALAARIQELRDSRSRIVAAGDLERKGLERNLHDGAQQRLVTLSLSLRLLRGQLAAGAASHALTALEQAEGDLERAVADLRELAHGIFPAVLADGGLAVAVHALAEEGRIPVAIGALPDERFPPAVETAAYAVVAEAARTAAGPMRVSARSNDGTLVVDIEEEQGSNRIDRMTLEDRLGALDGTLRVDHATNGRVTIHAELPCES
jgi:signal transduction histidine kinase